MIFYVNIIKLYFMHLVHSPAFKLFGHSLFQSFISVYKIQDVTLEKITRSSISRNKS